MRNLGLDTLGLVAVAGFAVAGCGGGGSSGGGFVPTSSTATPSSTTTTTTMQPRPTPPAPPPTADPLEADLRARTANAGITAVTRPTLESNELIALGRALFFDKIISGNKNVSCATCHNPGAATGDGLSLSLGEGATGTAPVRTATATDQRIARNAPPIFGVGAFANRPLFWDGRVRRDPATGELTTPEPALNGPSPARSDLASQLTTSLAAQAMFPPTSSEEMRGDPGENELADAATSLDVWARIMVRLVGTQNGTIGGIEAYRTLFRAAFPGVTNLDDLTFAHAARAIAAFEVATWGFLDAPLDRWLAGDANALSAQEKRGGVLFAGRARCTQCHSGPMLSDFRFHSIAAPQLGPGKSGGDDKGRSLVTNDARDDYRFRTAPLRQIALTGPYLHDGAFVTLTRVLRHYRDPARSLQDYDGRELAADLVATVDRDPTRRQARLASIDPAIGAGIPMNDGEIADIVAFLEALTDPAARTPVAAPASVPSGLPLAD